MGGQQHVLQASHTAHLLDELRQLVGGGDAAAGTGTGRSSSCRLQCCLVSAALGGPRLQCRLQHCIQVNQAVTAAASCCCQRVRQAAELSTRRRQRGAQHLGRHGRGGAADQLAGALQRLAGQRTGSAVQLRQQVDQHADAWQRAQRACVSSMQQSSSSHRHPWCWCRCRQFTCMWHRRLQQA